MSGYLHETTPDMNRPAVGRPMLILLAALVIATAGALVFVFCGAFQRHDHPYARCVTSAKGRGMIAFNKRRLGHLLEAAEDEIYVVAWNDNRLLATIKVPFPGCSSVCFSPDGKLLFTGSDAAEVRVFDTTNWTLVRVIDTTRFGGVEVLAVSKDGTRLFTGHSVKPTSVVSWDWKQGAAIAEAKISNGTSLVYSLSVAPDGELLAVGLSNPEVRLLKCDGLRPVSILKPPDPGEDYCAFCVRFTPDGRFLAVGGGNTVFLFDIVTAKRTAVFRGHSLRLMSLDFSDDGKLLASGSERDVRGAAEVYLWDLEKVAPAGGTSQNVGPATGVFFAPDGKDLITGALSGNGSLHRLDIKALMKE